MAHFQSAQMYGAHARDEMDKAEKFVDRYGKFLTPANAEISWFGKNMLLRYCLLYTSPSPRD